MSCLRSSRPCPSRNTFHRDALGTATPRPGSRRTLEPRHKATPPPVSKATANFCELLVLKGVLRWLPSPLACWVHSHPMLASTPCICCACSLPQHAGCSALSSYPLRGSTCVFAPPAVREQQHTGGLCEVWCAGEAGLGPHSAASPELRVGGAMRPVSDSCRRWLLFPSSLCSPAGSNPGVSLLQICFATHTLTRLHCALVQPVRRISWRAPCQRRPRPRQTRCRSTWTSTW